MCVLLIECWINQFDVNHGFIVIVKFNELFVKLTLNVSLIVSVFDC